MNYFLRICFMLILTLIASASFASDIVSSDKVQVSSENNTMTFSGNVVFIIDSGNVVFNN